MLRLMRMGKKKQPTYRIVATDKRAATNSRPIEIIGTYQPRLDPSGVKVDGDRALHWLRVGAKPSETVRKLLVATGVWDAFTSGATSVPDTAGGADSPVEDAS